VHEAALTVYLDADEAHAEAERQARESRSDIHLAKEAAELARVEHKRELQVGIKIRLNFHSWPGWSIRGSCK
jgi:hypothetical protein